MICRNPSNSGRNNAQIDEDHFGLDGCTYSGEAGVQQRTKDNNERQRISKAEGLIQELLQKIFIQVNHKFMGGLLGIKLSALSTTKSKVSTAHKLQLPVLTS
ncbi:hypothetical protein Tco_0895883 [Tanacetum coccineum]|uniref:Uncharacterized protein n=1 Tax=Tanacetum coccineum TaxID=301880 RepID=A0ABQ5CFU8_9ASTR